MRLLALLAVCALGGCRAPGTATGSVAGHTLSVADAAFALVNDARGKSLGALVALSDQPEVCKTLKATRTPKSATTILFTLARYTDTGEPLAPEAGEYAVVAGAPSKAGNYTGALFSRTDSRCIDTVAPEAGRGVSGSLKISALEARAGATASGTFDLIFGADHVTGSFSADFCDLTSLSSNAVCE